MKLLITGSSGFIGTHLTTQLARQSILFDILKRGKKSKEAIDGVLEIQWPENIKHINLSAYTSIIHLASAPANQSISLSEYRALNLTPIEYILSSISKTNPNCSFIFVTSQSAKAETDSIHGKVEWESEELINKHSGPWTIIRPGLVIGSGGTGLFNRILNIVKILPVIPLIGSGGQLIQPVSVETVVEALIKVSQDTKGFSKQELNLTIEPVTFKEFLVCAAKKLGKSRLFFPVPIFLIDLGSAILEKVFKNPPITRTNLLGLLHLELLDSTNSLATLNIPNQSLEQILDSTLRNISEYNLEEEAKFFYQHLFATKIPDRVIKRYVLAHNFCCNIENSKQNINLDLIYRYKLDPESIEFATRSRNTLLSKKFALLSYLAEIEPENFELYINKSPSFIFGFLMLGFSVVRAPWKLIKGKYLIWRYNLV